MPLVDRDSKVPQINLQDACFQTSKYLSTGSGLTIAFAQSQISHPELMRSIQTPAVHSAVTQILRLQLG